MIKIFIDLNSIKGIFKAENLKDECEKRGLNLIKTEQIGFNKFCLKYK